MLQKSLLLFLLFITTYFQVLGQDPSYINYDTKDGLPSSEVYDVEIDETGLIIISTDRGVCTYDGYDFKTYTTNDGLADNTNFEIYKDQKNRLWFTGYSGNISIYEDGKFVPYAWNDSLTTILSGYWIDHLTECVDGGIIMTNHFSLSKSVIKISLTTPPEIIQHNDLEEFNRHINFKDESILPFNDFAITFGNKFKKKPNYKIGTCIKHKNDWLHIVKNTVFKLNSKGEVIETFTADKRLSNIYFDRSDNLWIFGSEGLYHFPSGNLSAQPSLFFEGTAITEIREDYNGNYWITTLKKGIIFVPSFQIKKIPLPENSADRFLSIGKLNQHILFGNENRAVLACDQGLNCKTVTLQNNYSKQIKHINPLNDGLFFSGHEAREINGKIDIKVSDHGDQNFGLSLSDGKKVYFIERGFDIEMESGKHIVSTSFENPFSQKTTKIIQSNNNKIWLGTLKGLYELDDSIHSKNIVPYFIKKNQTFGRVNDIEADKNSNIWVATIGNGLYFINTEKNLNFKIHHLNSDLVNTILLQNDTTLWVGTNKGVHILKFEYAGDSLSVYDVKRISTTDGLVSNFINDIDYWNGNIYLATNKGICYFDPSIVDKPSAPVPIQINELIVNDSIYSVQDSLDFNHDKNDFFIHFTGINFRKNNESDFYKYRLIRNGSDADWFYTNEKNIRYIDLIPGNYTFEVNAQNNASKWNEKPASIYFCIHPHFTQTNWFKAVIILLVLAGLLYFYKSQIKRVQQREDANRKLEQAQLRIREAELSALRNQMNPHFVYNALNSIQNFIFKKDFEKANYYLVKFSRLMRSSLNFSRLDLITVKEELAFLNDYIELEKMRFPNKFICNFIVEEEFPIDSVMIPSLLLQPVLENIIKHAFKNIEYTGEMTINFSQNEKNKLKIVIEDNGPGLSTSKQAVNSNMAHKSLGLEIIKNRINLINESDPNTESSMTFTNQRDADPSKSGLKVVFILPEKYN